MKTEHNGRAIAFPNNTLFADLFEQTDNFNLELDKTAHNVLSDYCSIDNQGEHYSVKVKPHQHIIDFVKNNMIAVDYDSIYFKIIVHDNGWALVTAQYSQILGSHYLAYIDANTQPKQVVKCA